MIIRSQFIAGDIPATPDDPSWERVPVMTIPLSGQIITRPVWPEPSARSTRIRSVHNGTDIAFWVEWEDNTKNDTLTAGTFRDGMAIGLPMGDSPAFFCMGQLDHYINIWHWKADWEKDIQLREEFLKEERESRNLKGPRRIIPIPRRVSSVEDLVGGGFSTLTTKQKQGRIQGKAVWLDGFWRVVVRRPLISLEPENEARLQPGRVQAISIAIWNGENKERNGQKAVAPWFQLAIDPVASL